MSDLKELSARQSWKGTLGGLTTALLLLPVPAYAALTWTTWPSPATTAGIYTTGRGGWTDTSKQPAGTDSDWLYITAASGIQDGFNSTGTVTYQTTVRQSKNSTDTIQPSFSGLNNLTMTNTLTNNSTVTWQVAINSVNQYSSGNQFTYPNSGPSATQVGSGITLTNNTGNSVNYNVTVTFTFSQYSSWTAQSVSSSSFTVFFNGT